MRHGIGQVTSRLVAAWALKTQRGKLVPTRHSHALPGAERLAFRLPRGCGYHIHCTLHDANPSKSKATWFRWMAATNQSFTQTNGGERLREE